MNDNTLCLCGHSRGDHSRANGGCYSSNDDQGVCRCSTFRATPPVRFCVCGHDESTHVDHGCFVGHANGTAKGCRCTTFRERLPGDKHVYCVGCQWHLVPVGSDLPSGWALINGQPHCERCKFRGTGTLPPGVEPPPEPVRATAQIGDEAKEREAGRPRASWNAYFIGIAKAVATRATCDRAHVGCVLVKDRTIIATGYNGSIRGTPHCDDAGHLMEDGHCVRTMHAEANAIAQAAKSGSSVDGATAYVTHLPCWPCFKLLANAGVKAVVFAEAYRADTKVNEHAVQAGIMLIRVFLPQEA